MRSAVQSNKKKGEEGDKARASKLSSALSSAVSPYFFPILFALPSGRAHTQTPTSEINRDFVLLPPSPVKKIMYSVQCSAFYGIHQPQTPTSRIYDDKIMQVGVSACCCPSKHSTPNFVYACIQRTRIASVFYQRP